MLEVELSINDLIIKSKDQIITQINKKDNEEWYKNMNNKSTLSIYRQFKEKVEEIQWFRNGYRYSLMMMARSDTLPLEWRNWEIGGSKICKLCSEEVETLEHFLLVCPSLQSTRNEYLELQWPINVNKRDLISLILLFRELDEEKCSYYIDMLLRIWSHRRKLINSMD